LKPNQGDNMSGKSKSASKLLSKSFVDNNENIDEDAAGQIIIQSEQMIAQITEERKTDEKLASAKQIVKDLNSAYTSSIRYERAKIQYALEKIDEIQGGELNPSSGVNL
jgi:hypothetical protein